MITHSTSHTPPAGHLRERCLAEGVDPSDADIAAVTGFLDTILPALAEIEELVPRDAAVAGLFLPEAPQS